MSKSLEKLRKRAKALKKSYEAGETYALQRLEIFAPRSSGELKHADFLHVIAREEGFESWPKLKLADELQGLDRAQQQNRLKIALYHGQHWAVARLLAETPDLAEGQFALQVALLNRDAVERMLKDDPSLATQEFGPRRPMLHLAFSKHIHAAQEKSDDMIAIAEALVAGGADVNDSYPFSQDDPSPLSTLYGALGHANNMGLARWLLEQGADPNDGESLYHATELGHHDGLKMLLKHGAKVDGTNAIMRAMDFNDHEAVRMMIAAGGDPGQSWVDPETGEASGRVHPLHQAARRMNDAEMVRILLEAGADPLSRFDGMAAYELARVYGNQPVADVITEYGGSVELEGQIDLLARVADGQSLSGEFIDPAKLPDELRNMVRSILNQPDAMGHINRLIAAGMEWDRPDDMGVTPVQIAGWEGLPDVMGYFLSLKPDLGHINGYGGTLLTTIIHGSENCPERDERDYIACLQLALEEGVALPTNALNFVGNEEVETFLKDWAEAHPGQVVQGGVG